MIAFQALIAASVVMVGYWATASIRHTSTLTAEDPTTDDH